MRLIANIIWLIHFTYTFTVVFAHYFVPRRYLHILLVLQYITLINWHVFDGKCILTIIENKYRGINDLNQIQVTFVKNLLEYVGIYITDKQDDFLQHSVILFNIAFIHWRIYKECSACT